MTEKTEALRLADELGVIDYHGDVVAYKAATELRRLHQFAEDQIGRATSAEAALQMTKVTHALKIAAVEAQRDALLEALRRIAGRCDAEPMYKIARAAIAAAEGEKT